MIHRFTFGIKNFSLTAIPTKCKKNYQKGTVVRIERN